MSVPKIIHHIAPQDKERWHPMWERCYPTWKNCFSNFQHILWNDEKDIDNFVREKYPEYWKTYQSFPAHIVKIDFVRFCILHYYGGIYSDMDMYCYKNFYEELSADLHIVEAPYGEEFLESSLMISIPGHNFWIDCMELSCKLFNEVVYKKNLNFSTKLDQFTQHIILALAGPNLICRVWRRWIDRGVKTLPGILYNNHGMSYHPEYRTRHMLTGMWGRESLGRLAIEKTSNNSVKDILGNSYIKKIQKYAAHNLPSVQDFNFYYDYTNGGMKTFFSPDIFKGDIDNQENFKYD